MHCGIWFRLAAIGCACGESLQHAGEWLSVTDRPRELVIRSRQHDAGLQQVINMIMNGIEAIERKRVEAGRRRL